MDANPDIGKPLQPWQQWALANAVMSAAEGAAADFHTEILCQRSSEPPEHAIKAVRMIRGNERAWCRCGAELPVERDSDDIAEAVSRSLRQHLAEQQDG